MGNLRDALAHSKVIAWQQCLMYFQAKDKVTKQGRAQYTEGEQDLQGAPKQLLGTEDGGSSAPLKFQLFFSMLYFRLFV